MNKHLILLTIGALLLAAGISARSFVGNSADEKIFYSEDPQLSVSSTSSDDSLVNSNGYSGLQETGMISATYDCFGTFGSGYARNAGIIYWSFETPSGSADEYLFAGALWVGGIVGTDTLVSHGADGWSRMGSEYFPPDYPEGSVTAFEYVTDNAIRAEFYDTVTANVDMDYSGRPHIPMNLRVANRSLVWTTAPYNNIVFYDIAITNIGEQTIEKLSAGLYLDADVGWRGTQDYHVDDLAGSIPDENIAYIIDNNGDLGSTEEAAVRKILAAKLLACSEDISSTNFNWWISNASPTYDFGPRLIGTVDDPFFDFGTGGLGTPEGDVNKYYMLSHPEWDYDQIQTASIQPTDPLWFYPPDYFAVSVATGRDTKFLLSVASGDLMPDSSIRLIFAMFTADSVHTDADNYANLPYEPDEYLANLNLDGVLANAAVADSLVASLIDPANPVIGLHIARQSWDSVVIVWDPWGFSDVEGYEIYLSAIPTDSLPYPGVPAPWLVPSPLEHYVSTGCLTELTLQLPDDSKIYYVNVANRTASGVGSAGKPVFAASRIDQPAPLIDLEYAFFYSGGSAPFGWTEPNIPDIDHYNIYRFDDATSLYNRYRRFYDTGEFKDTVAPADSFDINGTIYYYYAMEPYGMADSGATGFEDSSPLDGAWYIVTAVDKYGFESEFSSLVQATQIAPRSKDVLVVTKSSLVALKLTSSDTIVNFYNELLAGYEYDIYKVTDTQFAYSMSSGTDSMYMKWRDMMPYKLVIVDEDIHEKALYYPNEDKFKGFTKYLLSGGKLAFFGSLNGLGTSLDLDSLAWCNRDHWFVKRFFGIDSAFYAGPLYYYRTGLPDPNEDTLFGLAKAQTIVTDLGDVPYDTLRYPYNSTLWPTLWPPSTPPGAVTFAANDMGEITHNFKARYPASSVMEGKPVGVRTVTDEAETYLFGFHLWYMEPAAARQLIDDILLGSPTGTDDPEAELLPKSIALSQNYPNPFNPNTTISFELPNRATVTLDVFNILGQRVRALVNSESLAAGSHLIEWDGTSDGGKTVSTGVYFYRLTTGETTVSRKMMLIK